MGVPRTGDSAPGSAGMPQPTATTSTTNQPNSNPATTDNASSTQQPNNSPRDPHALPQAALDLASKLFDLARDGETAKLADYLQAGIPANLTNSSGQTLLMLAAYYNRAATVSMLLGRGADPNALNDQGQSPLAGAVFKDHTDVVRVLVSEGHADPHAGKPDAYECVGMFKREACARVLGIELPEGGGAGGVEGAQVAAQLGQAYAMRDMTMGASMS